VLLIFLQATQMQKKRRHRAKSRVAIEWQSLARFWLKIGSSKDANNSSAYKEGSITKIPSDLPKNSGGQKGDSSYHNPIANMKAGIQHFLQGVVQNRTGRF